MAGKEETKSIRGKKLKLKTAYSGISLVQFLLKQLDS